MSKLFYIHRCQVTAGLGLQRRQGYQADFQRSCVKVNVYAGR